MRLQDYIWVQKNNTRTYIPRFVVLIIPLYLYCILWFLVIEFVEQGQVMDFDVESCTYKTNNEDDEKDYLSEDKSRDYFKDLVDGMDYCKFLFLVY